VLKDATSWARGTKDDKPILAANLMVMLLLKRGNVPLDRALSSWPNPAKKPMSPASASILWFKEHFDEMTPSFLSPKGGGAALEGSRVSGSEHRNRREGSRPASPGANGTSGHGSIPRLDDPVTPPERRGRKSGDWQTPMRLNETTRTYFEKLATISPPDRASAL